MEMRTVTIEGALFNEVPDTKYTDSCAGCAGDHLIHICDELPTGCLSRGTTWRRVEITPPKDTPTNLKVKWLPSFLTLYVPNARKSEAHEEAIIKAAGGVTSIQGTGSYIMADNSVCREGVTILKVVFSHEQNAEVTAAVFAYTEYLLAAGEESVLTQSNNGACLFSK